VPWDFPPTTPKRRSTADPGPSDGVSHRVLFTEPVFLFIFLPVLLALHVAPWPAYRNGLLLAASVVFYARGGGNFTWFLAASILLNYWAAIVIDRRRDRPAGRRLLILTVAANVTALGVFKYADFAVGNLNAALRSLGATPVPAPGLVLPIGISFFTFHAVSYVVDVYRRDAAAQKGPVQAALYLLLFPQLIAGPIIRYREIADQLARRRVSMNDMAAGIQRFVIGLGKKMLVANVVAVPVDRIFAMPADQLTAAHAWLAMACYTVQIYFDFSGYSDMAIGLARMFGFRFPENFRHPYSARSIQEFWRRWHISLSAWFRDYVYVPLGGSRATPGRTYLNLVTVFFLCGLWHGANWTFVVWGLYHGLFLVLERKGGAAWLAARPAVLGHLYAVVMVLVGWVFFRADSMTAAAGVLRAMAGASPALPTPFAAIWYLTPEVVLALAAGALGSMPWLPAVRARFAGAPAGHGPRATGDRADGLALGWMPSVAVMAALWIVLLASLSLVAARTYNPFIYFRF
jgi:alginate O-acetyltransferase complex protein AlgI